MEISTALGHIAHRCCPLALTLTQCRRRRVCVSRGFADRAISRDLAVFEHRSYGALQCLCRSNQHRTHTPWPNSQPHHTKRPAVARATAGKVRCWQEPRERVHPPATEHPPRAILALNEVAHPDHLVYRSRRRVKLLLQLSMFAPAPSFSTGLRLELRA